MTKKPLLTKKPNSPGFALLVFAIIGMLLPAVQRVREAARRSVCANNIRQLALAFRDFESALQAFSPGVVRKR